MPKKQPPPPLIRQSPLTGQWYCLTRYKQKGDALIVTSEYGRHNVTEQIEQLISMETEDLIKQRDVLLAACKAALPIVITHDAIERQIEQQLLDAIGSTATMTSGVPRMAKNAEAGDV